MSSFRCGDLVVVIKEWATYIDTTNAQSDNIVRLCVGDLLILLHLISVLEFDGGDLRWVCLDANRYTCVPLKTDICTNTRKL